MQTILRCYQKDEQDMQQALTIFAEFLSISGLEINGGGGGSEAIWHGSKQHCTDTFFGFVRKRRLKTRGAAYILPVINVLLKLKRTGRKGWKTLRG